MPRSTRGMRGLGLLALGLMAALALLVLVVSLARSVDPDPLPPVDATVMPVDRNEVDASTPTQSPGDAASPRRSGEKRSSVVLRVSWGGRPGQLGRRGGEEANLEAPMALAVERGEIVVLDQVNRRVERFRHGQRIKTMPLGSDFGQDLALGPDGKSAILDRLGANEVSVYGEDGSWLGDLPLGPAHVDKGDATGVFSDELGIYVERGHGGVVRIADAQGRSQPAEELPGRPTRDGRLLISAAIVDRAQGLVAVHAFDRSSLAKQWTCVASLGTPPLQLLLLDSDGLGRVYLGAGVGRGDPRPPYAIVDQELIVVRIDARGEVNGLLRLPPLTAPDEMLRPVAIDDQGIIYVMRPDETGLTVERYEFPPG